MVPSRPSLRTQGPLAFALAALLAVALVYAPHLAGTWVWDDTYLVRDNAALRTWAGLGTLLTRDLWGGATGRPSELYHPVPMVTLWMQARLGGIALVPMRAVNVVLHVLCATALFAWLRRRGVGAAAAWLAVGAFALHPSATEPVQWITGRHDTLGTLCVLAALLCVRPGVVAGTRAWAACAALCALAVLSKEPYVVAPVLVLLARVLEPGGRPQGERLALAALPFAGTGAVFALRAVLGIHAGSAQLAAPPWEHARNFASILTHYFVQLVRGGNGPTIASFEPLRAGAAAAVLVAAATATGVLVWLTRGPGVRARGALVGWLWFLVALAPHVVALPIIGLWGNRYAYLPGAGLAAALAFGLDGLFARAGRHGQAVIGAAALATLALLAARTAGEASAWRDEFSLYGRDIARAPGDGRARYHYAVAVQRRFGCTAAVPELERATRDAPDYPRGWHNLAGCLINEGRYGDAVAPARADARLSPGNARALYNLGVALALSGHAAEGAAVLARAVALEPGFEPARAALADARARAAAEQP